MRCTSLRRRSRLTSPLQSSLTAWDSPTLASVLFDGLPGTSSVSHDLNATGNANERAGSAEVVPLTGPSQLYSGNTSAMAADVDPSLLACGAKSGGHDAVFNFHLAKSTNVEIDAAGSTVTDPVINLYSAAGQLSKPTPATLENHPNVQADANPSPVANVSSASWLYYGADFSHLSAESQASVSVSATNDALRNESTAGSRRYLRPRDQWRRHRSDAGGLPG